MMPRIKLALLTILPLLAVAVPAPASPIDPLLARAQAPAGVVFEVVEAQEVALAHLLPQIRGYSERLRLRFPGLEIAVVSHGLEQFSLMSSKRTTYEGIHAAVESLVEGADIPVHVCGTHAGFYNIGGEAFPDFVDVAPSGPARIRDYENLGYVRIVLDAN